VKYVLAVGGELGGLQESGCAQARPAQQWGVQHLPVHRIDLAEGLHVLAFKLSAALQPDGVVVVERDELLEEADLQCLELQATDLGDGALQREVLLLEDLLQLVEGLQGLLGWLLREVALVLDLSNLNFGDDLAEVPVELSALTLVPPEDTHGLHFGPGRAVEPLLEHPS